jgi:hypothetical protein
MFWRTPHTSTGAKRRALGLVRATLLLDPPPYDWAVELEWPHDPAVSRTLGSLPLSSPSHRPPLRLVHARTRAGAVPDGQQYCLSPVGQGTPQIRSRPQGRTLGSSLRGASQRAAGR